MSSADDGDAGRSADAFDRPLRNLSSLEGGAADGPSLAAAGATGPSTARVNEIKRLAARGRNTAQIANRLGCSVSWVQQLAKRQGIVFRCRPRGRKPVAEQGRAISDLADDGFRIDEIAARLGCSKSWVRRIAEREGIKFRAAFGCRRIAARIPVAHADIVGVLAERAAVSRAVMVQRLVTVALDGGPEAVRRRLGKLALPTRCRPRAPAAPTIEC